MWKFNAQNGGLDTVHSAVPTNHLVVIFADLAMISQHSDLLLQEKVVRYDRARFAECAQVFSWVETETTCVADAARLASFVSRSMRLRRIFNDKKAVLVGEF